MSTTSTFRLTASASVYQERRAALAAVLDRPLLIPAGFGRPRQIPSFTMPFRASSHYLYFGGPPIPGGVLLIEPGSDGAAGCYLARSARGPEDAVWEGAFPPDSALASCSGVAEGSVVDPEAVSGLLQGRASMHLSPPCFATLSWVADLGSESVDSCESGPSAVGKIIDLRMHKDESDLVAMRHAASVTADAYRAAFGAIRSGARESDVAGALMGTMIAAGCGTSFNPIITVHGEVLHLEGYPNVLSDGDLLLIDSGAEEPGGYAADVTRTVPVSGRYSDVQRDLYEVVLRAERSCVEACVVGRRYREIHDLAARVITEGLVDLGFLRGSVDSLMERRAHTLFFPHGVGHLLGMDAHDLEDFGDLAGYASGRVRREGFGDSALRLDRDLEAGMVVTIEPGLYLIPAVWESESVSGAYADCVDRSKVDALLSASFGGIRIEDDVVVTSGAPEILTSAIPSSVADVEAALTG
ncbi:MAG: aminopeptidase P N-terminal domain-containing protein [Phycisphaerae bacterium]